MVHVASTAIGVLTSGGDAPGMNAALRAVVRTALSHGIAVYAIEEGYQGMVDGGSHIRFDVRQAILGSVQQGGNPSPFDRIQATRLAARCVEFLIQEAENGSAAGAFIGIQGGQIKTSIVVANRLRLLIRCMG